MFKGKSKIPSAVNYRIPKIVVISVFFICFGAFYPVYGLSVPTIGKVTLYRVGLAGMLISGPIYYRNSFLKHLSHKLIVYILLFTCIRCMSLFMSSVEALSVGVRMLEWFVESALGAYCIACSLTVYPLLLKKIYYFFLYIGGSSVLVMALQFLQFKFTGSVFALPLSMTSLGIKSIIDSSSSFHLYPMGPAWRVVGGFLEANVAGSFIAMLSNFVLSVSLFARSRFQRYLGASIFIMSLIALWGNGSRQSVFYIVLGSCFFIFAQWKYGYHIRYMVIIALSVFFAVLFYIYGIKAIYDQGAVDSEMSGSIGARMSKVVDGQGAISLGGRSEFYRDAINMVSWATCFLGEGEGFGHQALAGSAGGIVNCHNAFLIVLLENGFAAFWVLLAFCLSLFRNTWNFPDFLFSHCEVEMRIFRSLLPSWCAIWIASIFLNWTQINMSACWPFLGVILAFILRRDECKKVLWKKT
ncbi:MAG: hypothetical protein EOM00_12775 [Clostridia bacterium]|nr:hypothetical protein [Clostridia bacterium]